MKFGSLFAGIGGFDLAFEWAGMTCAWQVEIDSFCNQVLAKHWPDVPRYTDIRQIGGNELETVDVVIGGFPCQPHSQAGKQQGSSDDRDLWPEYRRIIKELKPRWVVAENVVGIRQTILDDVLSDLEGLDYEAVTVDIPAAGVNAPHRRHRFFIVAYTNGEQRRPAQGPPNARTNGRHNSGWGVTPHATSQQTERRIIGGLGTNSARETNGDANRIGPQGGNHKQQWQIGQGQHAERRLARIVLPTWAGGDFLSTPRICRVDDGTSKELDARRRLRALGNAVVPQQAYPIAAAIVEIEGRKT